MPVLLAVLGALEEHSARPKLKDYCTQSSILSYSCGSHGMVMSFTALDMEVGRANK